MSENNAKGGPMYRLILFVAGDERNSRVARENLDRICTEDLDGRCEIQIVDVLTDFSLAAAHQILLTPALLMAEPKPEILVIGNLNDRRKVRTALGIDQPRKIA